MLADGSCAGGVGLQGVCLHRDEVTDPFFGIH